MGWLPCWPLSDGNYRAEKFNIEKDLGPALQKVELMISVEGVCQ
ncbi:hypothetical protein [Candidatus Erwinia dacicola]|uniref:Uncharacterized protein n=1 Tax=Candidatus Erwinia dacicola TaxID=252393 RepID=A0A328TJU5_9GAMM|nr:hypothetical protein [Candidatus Erwinia dacicola]RAP70759.1 hypothetical protein ACZ87_02433 [Candidatus Erwinia dacicola]